jgi:hypothetical protein
VPLSSANDDHVHVAPNTITPAIIFRAPMGTRATDIAASKMAKSNATMPAPKSPTFPRMSEPR